MFKRYQSKPIVRLAYQIQPDDEIHEDKHDCYCTVKVTKGQVNGTQINFVAHEPVNVGDYVVYLNEDDIYHCNAEVFAQRNIIE